jgi:hypothetical protein
MRFPLVWPLSEEQRFGLVLAAALGLFAISETFKKSDRLISVSLFVGSALAIAITIGYPRILRPLNEGWQRLGKLLGMVVSPIVLGVIFFGLLTPLAAILRMCGRDELHLQRRPVSSYWIDRNSSSFPSESFKHPF